ncbi:MAG: PAS/PAC sensor-containing diguanylate cyclase/phosphodiesterase [Gallionellaceae bacterium]|nr:MAG: PAS/PAC sensor-containing diguanylate cyclase/phosphodiesterase [Gallionellaceae bacterium]
MNSHVSDKEGLFWLHPSHRHSMHRTGFTVVLLALGVALAWILPALPGANGIAGYLPLHTLLETISIVIAALVFAVGWNAYSDKLPGNIVLLSCIFLGVALLDFSHVLSFNGMPDYVTPSSPEKSINFWLVARALAAVAMLVIAIVPWRPFTSAATRYVLLAAVIAASIAAHWLFLFHNDLLPHTFIPGQGLTAFKINSEYVIIALNLAAASVFWHRMRKPQSINVVALFGAACTMAMSEFFFTLYTDVTDINNLLGHIYKVVSYLFIYHSIFVTTVKTPYRQLSAAQSQQQATLDAIPDLLFELDIEGRYHDFHSPRTELLAAPADEFLGRTVHDVLPASAAQTVMTALQEANEKGWSTGAQFMLQLPQGDTWFELSVARKPDGSEHSPHFIVLSRDVTERIHIKTQLADSRNLLKTVIDTAPMRIFWKDRNSRYLGCNPAFAKDAGLTDAEDIVGKTDYQLDWKKQADLYRTDDRMVMELGIPKLSYEEPQTTPDGRTIWLRTSKVPLRNGGNEAIGVLGVYEDITEHKQAKAALQRSDANLKRAQAVSEVGSWYLDIASNRLECSDEAYRIFGFPRQHAVDWDVFVSTLHPDDKDRVLDAWNKAVAGSQYDIEHRIVGGGGAQGRALFGIGTTQDITERKLAEDRIQYLANFDTLTGLPNRHQAEDHIKYALELAKRRNEHLALVFLDLDRFKDINDTLGHSIGDALLIQLAKRLRSSLREEDTVSRLGGDEFIAMFPGVDASGVTQVVNKLLDVIAKPYQVEQYELNITASIGIALYPEDGTDMESLSRNADTAMYRAKQEGQNGYRFFTAEMQVRSARKMQLANALRHALDRKQLQLVYQPQLSMHAGSVIGAEALLRWQHPELGTISPAEFIPVAEDSGMIIQIGEWVLRQAVRQAKTWMEKGISPLIMAVNLSAIQFRQPGLPDMVSRIMNEEGLPPEYLELELTEGVAMHDPQSAITMINELHDRGIRMSVDDFGTGYSSLSYLKKFKVYKLKIDQSFVRDINTDPEDKAIVGAIISMAKSLGLKTIAEGVETEGQLAFLREQGCDEVQGYYYSKPLPVEQFEAFVISRIPRLE